MIRSLDHIDGDAQRSKAGTFAGAGLQQPQLLVFNGKLDVLHVAKMAFEKLANAPECAENLGHELFEVRDWFRRAYASDDILALGIDQKLAIEAFFSARRIAGKGNAGRAVIAEIAEHHRLHVDRCAPMMRDTIKFAIGDGPIIVPRAEDRADGTPQLLIGIFGKLLAKS